MIYAFLQWPCLLIITIRHDFNCHINKSKTRKGVQPITKLLVCVHTRTHAHTHTHMHTNMQTKTTSGIWTLNMIKFLWYPPNKDYIMDYACSKTWIPPYFYHVRNPKICPCSNFFYCDNACMQLNYLCSYWLSSAL